MRAQSVYEDTCFQRSLLKPGWPELPWTYPTFSTIFCGQYLIVATNKVLWQSNRGTKPCLHEAFKQWQLVRTSQHFYTGKWLGPWRNRFTVFLPRLSWPLHGLTILQGTLKRGPAGPRNVFRRDSSWPKCLPARIRSSPNYVFAVLSKQFPTGEGVGEADMIIASQKGPALLRRSSCYIFFIWDLSLASACPLLPPKPTAHM